MPSASVKRASMVASVTAWLRRVHIVVEDPMAGGTTRARAGGRGGKEEEIKKKRKRTLLLADIFTSPRVEAQDLIIKIVLTI